jgi:hypothetical protein
MVQHFLLFSIPHSSFSIDEKKLGVGFLYQRRAPTFSKRSGHAESVQAAGARTQKSNASGPKA